MDLPQIVKRRILRYENGVTEQREVEVVTEYALTVFVDGQEFVTLVCTPSDLEDLVIGFLASEGVLTSYEEIRSLTLSEEDGVAYVRLVTPVTIDPQMFGKRYIASCCGKGRQSFYFYQDAALAKPVEVAPVIAPRQIVSLIERMQRASDLFRTTGGVHNASLCTVDQVLLSRFDIGRHNALDKLYGYQIREKWTSDKLVIAFSGRISSEVLLKVAKMGIGIVLSKSAPTALALQIADDLQLTTVGFVRRGAFSVYTHPERVQLL
ncbi:formate dehydrogenase accessory sulfurtransferase FdhD [Ferroacidibacillus organovorans]|uniref:Sulfur carrier protein FdhD n=1 Tax=Ferroacidibacillus organovorans TaxID=1765683 RepID=A0A853K9Q0_9BACL|nr:formate dehydrogenase accessory sulfurtransferase FdhD [Ferroacidibacillus organovorans]KYP81242.1 sufurtransferase FdhD [Ferroacidibacillus organovorans]OAG93746.1 sufurtransferase FdhD [Ferroacidibacillus organovorans]